MRSQAPAGSHWLNSGVCLPACCNLKNIVATTHSGKIRGSVDQGIHVFKGIPYGADTAAPSLSASATAAELERCDAIPRRMRQRVRKPGISEPTSEDCLALNVWTPGLRDGGKRPVMVYFHGGEYSSGSGSSPVYDGVRLCRRGDVVVVTVNHRLNAFGHLYLVRLAGPDLHRQATSAFWIWCRR